MKTKNTINTINNSSTNHNPKPTPTNPKLPRKHSSKAALDKHSAKSYNLPLKDAQFVNSLATALAKQLLSFAQPLISALPRTPKKSNAQPTHSAIYSAALLEAAAFSDFLASHPHFIKPFRTSASQSSLDHLALRISLHTLLPSIFDTFQLPQLIESHVSQKLKKLNLSRL